MLRLPRRDPESLTPWPQSRFTNAGAQAWRASYKFPLLGGGALTLLRTRPLPLQLVLAGVVPIAFGALCGWLLGESKTLYLILSLLAIAGGYLAGQEHVGWKEGALRGLVGGLLFGGSILLVHEATGKAPKADVPDPKIILVAITTVAGVILGAMGGRRRKAKEEAE